MIGIRHEDKSPWETRVALVPDDVRALVRDHGVAIEIETSPQRAFSGGAYTEAGATVTDGITTRPVIIGVKEVPEERIEPGRTYVFFSHTIKGQPANMAMLRRLMDMRCQLIDYELIVDGAGRRLVFFGRHAGLAGMIDGLSLLGRRWHAEGLETPFLDIEQASRYADATAAKAAVEAVGKRIATEGLPAPCRPLVCGFAGYGNVSLGAQEIYDLLPVEEIEPAALGAIPAAAAVCFKTVFREEHMVEPVTAGAGFDLSDYFANPDRYRGRFTPYLPTLTILVNGIYWDARYPRLVTKQALGDLYAEPGQGRLRVIADISCDIEGAIECTVRATDPGNPSFVYEPATGTTIDGVEGEGPVIMAVDTLPCELPVDASTDFSRAFGPFVPALANADWDAPLGDSGLPPELLRATIVYQGELTEPYRYLQKYL